jgi:hypothetical protein
LGLYVGTWNEVKMKNRARRLCSTPQSSSLGPLHFGIVRRVGVVFPSPPRLLTLWRWVSFASVSFDTLALGSSASASFDTLALGSLRLCVVKHVGVGFPPPPRLSTRGRWVPSASVSFDTLALG